MTIDARPIDAREADLLIRRLRRRLRSLWRPFDWATDCPHDVDRWPPIVGRGRGRVWDGGIPIRLRMR